MGASNDKGGKKINKENEIEKYSTSLIQIKILMNSVLIWEKTYNIEETLQTIYNDFISEKKYEKGYSIKWYYNKINIDFNNTTKIKQFLKENNLLEISTLEINQEILFEEKNYAKIEEYSNYFAIPYFNPFSLVIYNKEQNTLKSKKFKDDKILNGEVKFGRECAYCNGKNHFYIFGGILDSTEEELGIFLDFDLKKETLKNQININPPKRNHSMIYTEKKVYIVGGSDEKTLFYDTKEKTLQSFGQLNKKRFEPSLIRNYNYLYCFDASKKNGEKFSFEKFNLNKLSESSWEIIYPNISPKLGNNVYNQKFFGIAEDNKHNIIFLGGLYDNNSSENSDPNSTIFNIKYNLLSNTMELSDIPFEETNLVEKTFLPWDENTSFLLVNTQRRIKTIKFNKNDNKMEISELKQGTVKIKERKNKYKTQINLKNSLFGINFDMPNPTTIIKNEENSYKNDYDKKLINSKNVIIEGNNENSKIGENDLDNFKKNDNPKIYGNNVTNENIKSNLSNEIDNRINNNINDISNENNLIGKENNLNNFTTDNNVNNQPNENIKINENNTNNENIIFKNNNNEDNLIKNGEIKINVGDENNINNNINDTNKNDDINKEKNTNVVETPINNEDNKINKIKVEVSNNEDKIDDKKDLNNKPKENQDKEKKSEEEKKSIIYNINLNDSLDINYINQKELNKIAKSYANKSASRKVIKKEALKIMKKNLNYIIENNY